MDWCPSYVIKTGIEFQNACSRIMAWNNIKLQYLLNGVECVPLQQYTCYKTERNIRVGVYLFTQHKTA